MPRIKLMQRNASANAKCGNEIVPVWVFMTELLTTDEAAAYLRLSERKLYELVANGEVPCTKVTGRWLFPRAALDRWVLSGLIAPTALAHAEAPPIVGGSHDPLLEWTLRESRCGLASLTEGSEEGLRRLIRGEVVAAGIHMHRLDGDDEHANTEIVAQTHGLYDAAVIAFACRQQGFVVAAGNPLRITDMASVATSRARLAQRPQGAGAQLLLVAMLARGNLGRESINLIKPPFPTGLETAHAIRAGHADCGIATLSVARAAGLDFVPLVWERFDLVLRQRDYFRPGPQTLLKFMRGAMFRERAVELGGYDVASAGDVRWVQ
jgi:excisionase family DNA binding protein